MLVATILHAKGRDVATIRKERSVADAVAMLRERGIGALVVTSSSSPVEGMFSERDIVRALATHADKVLDRRDHVWRGHVRHRVDGAYDLAPHSPRPGRRGRHAAGSDFNWRRRQGPS